ncbi:MAG: GNAT family N-acetyltransferase [Lachnospiraceae bacterium]|nr:GNAT family N-acetyltransferase [Lachnospiraceae bacterium]
MLRLRPFKSKDSEIIASWLKDEDIFWKWGGERFGDFPISARDIEEKYLEHNGDCTEYDNFYPLIAYGNDGVVGHFIIRYINGDPGVLRFGWVIVDDRKRGKGYGKRMLELGLEYAFKILKAKKVTIGVFENNESAYKCYKSLGFKEAPEQEPVIRDIKGEQWKVIELEYVPEITIR